MQFTQGESRRIDCGFWKGHLATIKEGPDDDGYYTVHIKETDKLLKFTAMMLKKEDADIDKYNLTRSSANFRHK